MRERKIVDYMFVICDYAQGLDDSVEKRIEEGYQPYFGPVMAFSDRHGLCNGQAMVKYEDEK